MRAHPVLTAVYFILRLIVAAILVINVVQGSYESAFICGLSLVLFLLPSFLEHKLRVDIPSVTEIIILLFIFAAEILGELSNYYAQYEYWDTMLHTVNGFLCAAFGFSMVDILTRNKQEKFRLSPLYVALVAFCFSMTVGVLWEFFEYGMDVIFHTNMQKDTVMQVIPVGALGTHSPEEGYLDIGLHDTMADLFVNFLGAVVFSILGYVYIRRRGEGRSGRLLRHFLPELTDPALPDSEKISPAE